MGSGEKRRWRFPSFSSGCSRSHSNSSAATTPCDSTPSSPQAQTTPKEFLCPISGLLMADPVILPTGQTFERVCIKACIDLGIPPPLPLPPLPTKDAAFLVPNLALRSTILSWCDERGLPRPRPLDTPAAIRLVRSLTTTSAPSSSTPSPTSSFCGASGEGDAFFDSCASPPPLPPGPPQVPAAKSTPPCYYSSSSSEIVEDESLTTTNSTSSNASSGSNSLSNSSLEAQIISKFKSSEVSEQEEGLLLLRHATRDSKEQRSLLCTTTLLAALRPFLLSRLPSLQSNAVAALVNLSLDPVGKIPIVRSGTVPPVVAALGSLHPEIRSHAAAALFSLAVEEENRAAIGALGAIPPLLKLVARRAEDARTMRDAALALYHLSSGCSTNRAKLVKLDGARTFLAIAAATEQEEMVMSSSSSTSLGGVAIMVMANLAGCNDGRAALMDAGAVEAVVRWLRRLMAAATTHGQGRMEQCVAVLYGMSKGSLRFRGLAKAAGAEEVLSQLTEDGNGGGVEEGKARVVEMARRTLKAIGGERHVGGFRVESIISDGGDTTTSSSTVSNNGGVMSFPRWQRGGRPALYSSANSTEF